MPRARPRIVPAESYSVKSISVSERVIPSITTLRPVSRSKPEYRPLVEARIAAIRGAFGASAEPGYTDPALVLERSGNPEYDAAPRAGISGP